MISIHPIGSVKLLSRRESILGENYAIDAARKATCCRSKCGSAIVSEHGFIGMPDVIGTGYNSMPCNSVAECFKDSLPSNFKSDKTCCIHAEQRAIMDALAGNADKLPGSTLFFIRLDENDNPKVSGDPYCTICSKMALDVGIKWFCLYQSAGWVAYDTTYYNQLSFQYKND